MVGGPSQPGHSNARSFIRGSGGANEFLIQVADERDDEAACIHLKARAQGSMMRAPSCCESKLEMRLSQEPLRWKGSGDLYGQPKGTTSGEGFSSPMRCKPCRLARRVANAAVIAVSVERVCPLQRGRDRPPLLSQRM